MYLLIIGLILMIIMLISGTALNGTNNQLSDTELYNDLQNNKIDKVEIIPNRVENTGVAHITYKSNNNTVKRFNVSDVQAFRTELRTKYNVSVYGKDIPSENTIMSFIPMILIMVVVFALFMFIMQQAQGGGGGSKVMSFGKSRAKMVVDDKKKVTFKNVAGLKEEKEDLEEVVDFLKKPRKFRELGARIPKGVILVGPPGTGKTLLAKAVAGEAGVPFFSISGSDFVEMFVGVGASRVRDLFEQAKKNSPCIVFIDEIDAVGRKRGAGLGGGHDEREQTLNQLLVEMDGFGVNEGVIIMAATNRVDILDPALLRPGRFDRRVYVGHPDIKGREEILEVHAKGKPLGDDMDLGTIAKMTYGFTGADLENLLNESAILAARKNKRFIGMGEVNKAFVKVVVGTEKKSRKQTDKDRKITAYHEAGHAIIHKVLPELDPVHSISIIPTGSAGGYTMPLKNSDPSYRSKLYMEQDICALLGGRVAEELIIKDVTTGASNDIMRVSQTARAMITKYGMSNKLGPILFGDENDEVFIGRDFGHVKNYGDEVAKMIDEEVSRVVETAHEEARRILKENMDILHKTAELLLAKEKVTGEEFDRLFEGVSVEEILEEDRVKKEAAKKAKAEAKEKAALEAAKKAQEAQEQKQNSESTQTSSILVKKEEKKDQDNQE